jgi:hypothetical protein
MTGRPIVVGKNNQAIPLCNKRWKKLSAWYFGSLWTSQDVAEPIQASMPESMWLTRM